MSKGIPIKQCKYEFCSHKGKEVIDAQKVVANHFRNYQFEKKSSNYYNKISISDISLILYTMNIPKT